MIVLEIIFKGCIVKISIFESEYKIIKKAILLAIPSLFIIGIPIHFLYELTGKISIIGAIVPVNESIFEHFKLATLPLILWWIISYYVIKKKVDILCCNFGINDSYSYNTFLLYLYRCFWYSLIYFRRIFIITCIRNCSTFSTSFI